MDGSRTKLVFEEPGPNSGNYTAGCTLSVTPNGYAVGANLVFGKQKCGLTAYLGSDFL